MNHYDVIVVGGGIAGSVTAKYTALGGLRTLLIEREKTPREKACSGIQFPYFERIIGDPIPRNRLCKIQLTKIKIILRARVELHAETLRPLVESPRTAERSHLHRRLSFH